MTTRTKKNGLPRAPRIKAERLASIKAFAALMSGPPAKAAEKVFGVDAKTAKILALIERA